MSDCELSPILKRLDRLSALDSSDGMLDLLVRLGSGGMSPAVGMLLNGVLVKGTFSHESAIASAADQAVERLVLETSSESERAEFDKYGRGMFTRRADEAQQQHEQARALVQSYLSRLSGDDDRLSIDDIDVGDIRDFYRETKAKEYVNLTNARLLVAGDWTNVGVVRIAVREISAWWLLDQEDSPRPVYHRADDSSTG